MASINSAETPRDAERMEDHGNDSWALIAHKGGQTSRQANILWRPRLCAMVARATPFVRKGYVKCTNEGETGGLFTLFSC
jgi:hypothetical protein